jgi:hypothetical protein
VRLGACFRGGLKGRYWSRGDIRSTLLDRGVGLREGWRMCLWMNGYCASWSTVRLLIVSYSPSDSEGASVCIDRKQRIRKGVLNQRKRD